MTAQTDWTQNFFNGLIVESQRRLPQQTGAETEFLARILNPKPGDRLLDVPCGNGRLSIALAERGCRVTGVDPCSPLLADARGSAAQTRVNAEFEERDMRDLPWAGEFDHVVCFGNSFSYFGEQGNEQFLRACFKVLRPGGQFVLETRMIAESVFMNLAQRRWYPLGDLYFLHDPQYDPASATVTSNYTLIRGAEVEHKTAVYNVYTYRELTRLISQIGFGEIRTFGSLSGDPFRLGAPGLWLACRKG
jgi:SAM-dependent methyltransferase